MTSAHGELAIPDTNVLIHLLRMDCTGRAIETEHSLTRRREQPILSSVVEAEVLCVGRYWRWGRKRMDEARELLRSFVRLDAGHPEIVAAYVELYCEARRVGRYREFRQNDLWIAATARVAGAVLYTCNAKDFDWIDPAYVAVVGIEQPR